MICFSQFHLKLTVTSNLQSKHLNDISSDKKRHVGANRVQDNLQMYVWGMGGGFLHFHF